MAGCQDVNAALHQQSEASRFSADLLVQFTKAADASNRAVMAASEEVAVAAAREASEAKQALQNDVDRLGPMLRELKYKEESRLLEQFGGPLWPSTGALDNRVLGLAVEGTEPQGAALVIRPGAQKAADAIQRSLDAAMAAAPAQNRTEARALAMTAVAAVREIQALQAPHIADPDDAAMTRFEQRMAAAEAVGAEGARRARRVSALRRSRAGRGGDQPRSTEFMIVHAEIIVLSRTEHQRASADPVARREAEARRAAVRRACARSARAALATARLNPGSPGRTRPSRPVCHVAHRKPVADPGLAQQVSRIGRVDFDLLAELGDERPQMLGLLHGIRPQIAFRIVRCVSTRSWLRARSDSSSNSFGVSRISVSPRVTRWLS